MEHEKRVVWIAWAIIIGIIGSILSFVGPNVAQAIILKTGNTLYIDTPVIANVLFFVGVVLLVLFCAFMYLGKKLIVFTVSSLILSIGFFYMGLTHYLIMTKEKIEEKPIMGIGKASYGWEDVAKGKMLITDMESGAGTLVLTFKDGHEMEFKRNDYMMDNFGMINRLLEENGVVYDIKEVNPK